jgi:poly-gamma-glutamate capsule biosynthesis protein CapA/YwtB (metallophosphatase superfamily)
LHAKALALLVSVVLAGSAGPRTEKTYDLTIAASGDLLIHSPVYERALRYGGGRWYDFLPMLARVRPIVRSADLAICHVETPMGAGAPSGYPRFNSPRSLALAIRWTGWDACDTASNHSVDRGQAGIAATLGSLDRWRIGHTGSARSAAEARRILILPVKGIKVAFLAYAYGTNGLPLPYSWSVNLIDARRIAADGLRARRAGADLVIVNLHAGDEYSHAPNAQQLSVVRYVLARRAADVIIGQHVHVVQPIRRISGHYVVFGEGNLLSNQTTACCPLGAQDGLIALIRVRLVAGQAPQVVGVDYVPTWVEHPSYTVQPVGYALARGAGGAVAAQYRASYWRTVRWAGVTKQVRPLPPPGSFAP